MSKSTKTKKSNKLLNNLYKIPKKDKGLNAPRFIVSKPNEHQQADLLFLPNDDGFKYVLVITDLYNSKTDAEPLKTKDAVTVKKAFEAIYARDILKMPEIITTDAGSEFKGVIKDYFKANKVFLRTALPGRHRSLGIVESANKKIGKTLHKRMTAQELITGVPSSEWVDDLNPVIKKINKKSHVRFPKLSGKIDCKGDACNLLEVGEKVRIALDEPRDATEANKKLHGKFRASDIRWEIIPTTITNVIIQPDQPALYAVANKPHTWYTKNQLQVVLDNEQLPKPEKYIRGKPEIFKVEKILDKKKIKNVMKVKIQWVGYKNPTWERYATIKVDVPELLQQFENKNKKSYKDL